MKATSTENFHDVIAIDFELQTFPNDPDKFIVSATNRDDIFCFVFEGSHLADACRKAGLFDGWEKDQKIRELEKELGKWKREAADCLRLRDEVRREKNKEINKLKQQLQQAENDKKRLTYKYNLLNDSHEALTKAYDESLKDVVCYEDNIEDLRHKYNLEREENEQYKEAAERRFNEELHDFEVNNKKYDGKIMEEILKRNSGRYQWDEKPADNVNHPSHYTGKYECIDVMQDVFGNEATDNFCLCNAFKYIWRARKKNGLEDVKKAVWYLNKYIEEAEKRWGSKKETNTDSN